MATSSRFFAATVWTIFGAASGRLPMGGPGKFRLGITTIQPPPTLIERDLDLGTDYTVVIRYNMPQSSCTLWINPSGENDTSSRVDYEADETGWSIREFGFLQTAY